MTQREKGSVDQYGVFVMTYEKNTGDAEVEDGLGKA